VKKKRDKTKSGNWFVGKTFLHGSPVEKHPNRTKKDFWNQENCRVPIVRVPTRKKNTNINASTIRMKVRRKKREKDNYGASKGKSARKHKNETGEKRDGGGVLNRGGPEESVKGDVFVST